MNYIKVSFFTTLLISSLTINANTIFKCKTRFSPMDQNYDQSKDAWLNIESNSQNNFFTVEYFSYSNGEIVNQAKKNNTHYGSSRLSYVWAQEKYLSMVYLGGNNWGAFIKFKENNLEEEFICKETPFTQELLDQVDSND